MIDIFDALNSINQLFLIHKLHILRNEVLPLEFSPQMFNWIEICTNGRCWPPINALFLIVGFCNQTGVLWIIILHKLHKTMFSTQKMLLKEGQQMFDQFWMYNIPSIIWSKTHISLAPLLAFLVHTFFDSMLCSILQYSLFPYLHPHGLTVVCQLY